MFYLDRITLEVEEKANHAHVCNQDHRCKLPFFSHPLEVELIYININIQRIPGRQVARKEAEHLASEPLVFESHQVQKR